MISSHTLKSQKSKSFKRLRPRTPIKTLPWTLGSLGGPIPTVSEKIHRLTCTLTNKFHHPFLKKKLSKCSVFLTFKFKFINLCFTKNWPECNIQTWLYFSHGIHYYSILTLPSVINRWPYNKLQQVMGVKFIAS